MYDDFVHLVHKSRAEPRLSANIRGCCDHIDLRAQEKIMLSDIAKKVGYAEYCLSRKFRTETGMTVSDYIKVLKNYVLM